MARVSFAKNWFDKNFLISIIVIILSLFGISSLQEPRLKQITESGVKTDYQKEEEIEKVKVNFLLNTPSFGFSNLIADWTLLRFFQYFGDGEARDKTGYSLSPDYLEAVVKHDPLFVKAYLLISPASSIYAGRPDKTVPLMAKGLEKLSPDIPDAYLVWLYKGVDEILFIGDIEAAKKSYQKAAEWAQIAGDTRIEKAARDTVQFLAKNPNSKQAQVGAWFMVWVNAPDDFTRKLAKTKIEKLGGKLDIYPDGRVIATPPKEE